MTVLFTDTSSNLPKESLKKHNIKVIRYSYFYEDENIDLSREDFDGKAFYDSMREGRVVNTSMINMAAFEEAFESELSKGNDVIYLGMSSGLSGSMNIARLVADELKEEYPDRQIEIVDTLAASLGEGFLVLDAAMYLDRGMSASEVAEKIRRRTSKMCQCLTVDDINYLKRTGRVSGPVAFIGSLLGIRPLLRGNSHGKIVMYGKVRGAAAAISALAERYDQLVIDRSAPIGIAHADNPKAAEKLLSILKEQKGFTGKHMTVYYEPVTGSHVGPGTVALFFYGNARKSLI